MVDGLTARTLKRQLHEVHPPGRGRGQRPRHIAQVVLAIRINHSIRTPLAGPGYGDLRFMCPGTGLAISASGGAGGLPEGCGRRDNQECRRQSSTRRIIGRTMDPYQILGIARGCTRDEVRAAFRARAWHAHPDRGGDEQPFIELWRGVYKQVLGELGRAPRMGSIKGRHQGLRRCPRPAAGQTGESRRRPSRSARARRSSTPCSSAGLAARPDPRR